MKRVTHCIRLLGIGLISAHLASPAQSAGTSAAQFLKMGAGARATAMGDAYSAIAEDATAAYWNPAGLVHMNSKQLAVSHNNGLEDTAYQYVGAAMPTGNGALAVSIYRLDFGSIDAYTAADARDGSFDAGSTAASFTAATKMNQGLSFGFTAKYIAESIEDESASSFAADAGVMLKKDRWSAAAVLQHVGPGLKMVQEKAKLPQTVRLGASYRMLEDRLLFSVDAAKPNDDDMAVGAGAEFKVVELLSLRGGYKVTPGNRLDVDGLTGVTAGLGFNLSRFTLDYAIAPFGDLGANHRVSILVRFGNRS